jgi:hypothetical protein
MALSRANIAWFLIVEVAWFALASLTHSGVLLSGHENHRAKFAELAIATLLGIGLIAGLALPHHMRPIALAVQGLALIGVLTGFMLVASGAGPQTAFDLILHGTAFVLLLLGFILTLRSRA